MPKTKVVNMTGSSISVKEGTAGVFRTVCQELKDDEAYTVKGDKNATYREYWCVVPPDDDKRVVLSSDDCMEYKELHVKLNANNEYTWDAVRRRTQQLVQDAGDKEAAKQHPAQTSSTTPGFFGKIRNIIKGGPS